MRQPRRVRTTIDRQRSSGGARLARVTLALTVLTIGCAVTDMTLPRPSHAPISPAGQDRGTGAGSVSADTDSGIRPPVVVTRSAKISDQLPPSTQAPIRLRAPRLGIDAAVAPVGVKPDGQLAVAALADTVSWYRYGSIPGGGGSAVLAGHVDWKGRRGVFWRLDELRTGDLVEVVQATGRRTFRVIGTRQYAKSALPVKNVFGDTGPPRLVLITCGGSFDRDHAVYRDNIVVTAEPADVEPAT